MLFWDQTAPSIRISAKDGLLNRFIDDGDVAPADFRESPCTEYRYLFILESLTTCSVSSCISASLFVFCRVHVFFVS
jgi:hypothetical protein